MSDGLHDTGGRHRLPPGAHVGAVRLQVADLDRSLPYYEVVIGLQVLDRADGVALLGADPQAGALVELHERPGVAPMPRRGRLGLYHYAILLPARAALGRFVRHLRESSIAAGMSDHLVSEAIYLTDPDGLGIEVYADRPRQSWRYDGGQLVMDTRPLDVDSLLAAAGTESWTGVPPGTVIGHVHLFVGDLERSAAFYHESLGFDQTVWSYPGALFMSAGGYHHHLGTNTWAAGAPPATENDARLLEWELVVPTRADAAAALAAVAGGAAAVPKADGGVIRDPWGTPVRLRAAR
jgi:catechol 2,3-dioxygenase